MLPPALAVAAFLLLGGGTHVRPAGAADYSKNTGDCALTDGTVARHKTKYIGIAWAKDNWQKCKKACDEDQLCTAYEAQFAAQKCELFHAAVAKGTTSRFNPFGFNYLPYCYIKKVATKTTKKTTTRTACPTPKCGKSQYRDGCKCESCTCPVCKPNQYCTDTCSVSGEYRSGSCSKTSTTDGYTCNPCSSTTCTTCPSGQYRIGSCTGTNNGYSCVDAPPPSPATTAAATPAPVTPAPSQPAPPATKPATTAAPSTLTASPPPPRPTMPTPHSDTPNAAPRKNTQPPASNPPPGPNPPSTTADDDPPPGTSTTRAGPPATTDDDPRTTTEQPAGGTALKHQPGNNQSSATGGDGDGGDSDDDMLLTFIIAAAAAVVVCTCVVLCLCMRGKKGEDAAEVRSNPTHAPSLLRRQNVA